MKWLDTRLHKPSCNHADKYIVVALFLEGHPMVGRATWMPTRAYTDGEWQEFEATNGNKHGRLEILFWQEHPELPKVLRNEGRKK